ncbi:MAG TPA: hypothetical protein VJQ54_18860, partial [Candidatus Sulfotelmatobacter sp.]|nr:hypothetical protein [Candidatus Sulfotelmatobacter sp.]
GTLFRSEARVATDLTAQVMGVGSGECLPWRSGQDVLTRAPLPHPAKGNGFVANQKLFNGQKIVSGKSSAC